MRTLRQEVREFSFFICVTGCYFVAQAGLKFMIILRKFQYYKLSGELCFIIDLLGSWLKFWLFKSKYCFNKERS